MRKFLSLTGLALAACTTAYAQLPTNPLAYHLAAYYPFEGNAQDALGNIHGTLVGGMTAVSDRNLEADHAYSFDGYSGYVDLGNSLDTVFVGPNAQFAITAWVKLRSTDPEWTDNRLFVNKSGDSGCGENEQEFYFRYYQGELNFSFGGRGHSFARYISSDFAITDTLWHHLVVTYDATASGNDGLDRVRLYADGLPRATRTLPNSFGTLDHMTAGTAHLGIGNRLGSTGLPCTTPLVPGYFQGALDDIAIYDRVLTDTEVLMLATPWRNGPLATVTPLPGKLDVNVLPTASHDGRFAVKSASPAPLSFSIVNAVGQTVQHGVLPAAARAIDLHAQPKGTYLIRFSQDARTSTQRVVVE